jgi:RimJ/RimL family protein N-acetyltransferase
MLHGAILETDRLILRPFRPDDLDALVPVLSDPGSMRYYPHPFSREECQAWIDRQLQRYGTDGFGLWAVEYRPEGKLIGDCGPTVQMVDGTREVELGWHIHPAYQNRGIATEAGLQCRDYAFQHLGRRRLISLVRPENVPSCRVAEKIGMHVERDTRHGSDGWVHHVYVVEQLSR